ncbi:MAG: hypothetical protein HY901_24890 [Deltaproteobacteria bacterium]|nr:hypothetical protein [Deltaproteobacteria bacterium]
MRLLLVIASLLALVGCAHSPDRLERYRALSQPAKDGYDKYHQFLTDSQQERYLAAATDEERVRLLADLHIEERLSRYPPYVQTAIWSRDVVPGMDKEAVLLSWGRPDSVDRLDADSSKGIQQEIWAYRRGPQTRDDYRVTIIQGVVTVVEKP